MAGEFYRALAPDVDAAPSTYADADWARDRAPDELTPGSEEGEEPAEFIPNARRLDEARHHVHYWPADEEAARWGDPAGGFPRFRACGCGCPLSARPAGRG